MSGPSIGKALTAIGFSRPAAFLIILAYAVSWPIFDRESLNMHGVRRITWAMTPFI